MQDSNENPSFSTSIIFFFPSINFFLLPAMNHHSSCSPMKWVPRCLFSHLFLASWIRHSLLILFYFLRLRWQKLLWWLKLSTLIVLLLTFTRKILRKSKLYRLALSFLDISVCARVGVRVYYFVCVVIGSRIIFLDLKINLIL